MSKSAKSKIKPKPEENEAINSLEQPEVWDVQDPNDQSFWEEFFRIEELLNVTDELNPPTFSISVQNHQTGEVKTFSHIHLSSIRKKIVC